MPISKSALKNIYATLQKGGYTQDYETFEKGFTGNEHYANRKKVYDMLTANGAQIGNSYEDFMRRIYVAPVKPSAPAAAVQKPAAGQTAHPQQTAQAAAPVQRAPAAKPKQRNGQLTAAQRQAYIARAQQMGQQVGASMQRTRNRMDYAMSTSGLRTPRVQLGSKASGGAKLGENSRVVATQPKFNPATGKMERVYLTELGNEYTSRAAADMEQNEIDQAVQQQLYPGYKDYDDKQAVAAQAPATAVVANLWKAAEAAYEADSKANAEKFAGNPLTDADIDKYASNLAIKAQRNEVSRLKRFDLQKMSDNAWARVGKQMTASCYARLRKMYPNALERQVQASAEKEARALVQNAVYKYAVKMNAPKSQLDYFMKTAVDANLLTSISRGLARSEAGTTGDMAAYEAAMGEYGKSHRWTGVFGTATGMAFDPTNWVGGYIGSLGGKAALNIGGRFVLGSAPGVGARLFGSTMAGRLATGAASGMGMMGTYEGVKEAERQWVYGGHVNPETRENEGYSAGAVALSALKGAGLGAMTGMVSPLVGNVADKVVQTTTSATGKVATRLGEVATSAVAEGTIFAMPAVISGQESFVDAWTESMAMIVGFKGQHMVKSAGQVIAGMRPVANPRTMEERNKNRRGFAENLKRTMDAGPNKQWNAEQPDVRFTKEELAELKQMGYGNLASLLTPTEKVLPQKKASQPKHPKNTDGKTAYFDVGSGKKEAEADPKMKWLQQHPEFDGYATMEKLMQDPNVSQAARAKAYYMLTGRLLPMGTITGWNVGKDDKGNIWVKSVTSEGEVVTSRRFRDEALAKREEAKIIRQVELNTVDMGEQYKEMQANAAVVETAIKAVAPNADVNEAMRVYGEVKKGNKGYDSYKDLAKSIDEAIASNPEAVERAKTLLPENIRKDIAEQTGVEVDKALGKPEAERTDAEKQAVQTYLDRLYDKAASDDAATPPDAQLQGPEQFAEAYAKHRTHKGRGQVVPATMKAGDRKVYVIDGDVVQYADKSGIDVAKSDKSIVVCDAETGKYEYTSPDQLMNVGEPADPSTLSEAYMANERAKEAAANGEGTAEGNAAADSNAAANGDVSADGDKAEVVEPAYTDGSRVEINGHEYDVKSAGEKTVVLVDEHGKELAWTRSALDAKLESGDAEVLEPKAEAAPDVATEGLKAGDVFEDSDGNALTVKRVDGDKVVAVGADGKEQTYKDGMFEQMVESGVLKRAQKTEEPSEATETLTDNQGNPVNDDGTLKVEAVQSVDELTDEDFSAPTRNVQLPTLPQNVDAAIGANGKPVIIKKNILGIRHGFHSDESRAILKAALYNTDLVGQRQPNDKPLHWVAVRIDDESPTVVLEVNENKDNIEIVDWFTVDERESKRIYRIKKQAEKNGGELVMLSPKDKVESLSTPQPDLYSESKGAEQSLGVQAEVPQAEVQENAPMPMRVVGKGKNAAQEEDWLATTPKRGHDYVFKESGLDAEEANAFVENKVAEAEKNLEKVKGKAPKMGTNIAAYKEAKADYEARVAEAQKAVDYWHAVKAERDKVLLEERRARKEKDKALYDDAVAQEEQRKAEMAQKAAEQEALGSNAVAPAIKEKWENAPKVDGGADEITLPNGEVVTGHYVLTESGAASASHQATNGFAETEGYPVDVNGETVNDRDYKRDAEAQQVTRGMAADYDSRALQSPVVVSGDGVVLSGNGRTMAGEIAAVNGSDAKYNAYLRGHASKFGFTTEQVEGFKHPRVVFVPDGEMPYTSETFAKFNQREQKSQSRTEMAVKLGKVVDDALFGRVMDVIGRHESLAEFYADDAAIASVVKELADAGVIPQTEMAQLFDGGRLSESGQAMVEGVLVGKVFQGSPDAVRQITEVKSMRKAVMAALPEVVACHRLGGGYDLSKELAAAVDLVYKARKAGFKLGQHVSQHARQGNLFQLDDGATVADYNNAAVMMLADVMNDGRVTQLKKVLSFYNTQAADSAQGIGDMFAGGVKSKGQIINEVNELLNNGQEYDRRTPSVADGQGVGGEGGKQGDVAGPSHQGGAGSERGLSEAFDGLAAQLKTADGEERKRVLGEMRDGIARFAEENGYPVPEFLLTREDFLAAVPEKDRAKYVEWLDDGAHMPAYYTKGKVYVYVEGCETFDKDVNETLAHEYTHADNAEFPENVNALTYALEDTHEVTRDELREILREMSQGEHYDREAERLEAEDKDVNKMLADEVIAHAVARMVVEGEQVLDGITKNPTLQFIIKRAYKARENERQYNIRARENAERHDNASEGDNRGGSNNGANVEGESANGGVGRPVNGSEGGEVSSERGRSTVSEGKEVAAPSEDGAKVGVTDGEKSSATGDVMPSGRGNTPLSEKIATASAEVNTEPTEAQKEAGNYKKGHVQVGTFDITIEQPQGSVRKGTDADGKQWESKMNNTYGYIRGAVGVDGDHIDVFLSNDIDGWNGRRVFVVDQYNPDGSFDEHKVMLGFNDADEAKSDYLANYENGWENGRRIDVTAVNLEDFEKWIASSKRKTKPFGDYSSVKNGVEPSGEGKTDNPRQQKAVGKSAQPPTREESILRDVVIEHMKGSGLDVIGTEDGQRVLDMANDDGAKEHRVYHGSGAEFDHFDHSHMGEGEGAQAYGWGTYVTEVRGIGEGYAIRSKNGISMSREEWSLKRSELESNIYRAKEQLPFLKGEYKAEVEAQISEWEEQLKDYEPHNYLYTVEIPDDNGGNYLDWNGHPAKSLLKDVGSFLESNGFERVQDSPARYERGESTVVLNPNATGADLYAELQEALGSDKKASLALAELGYAGIKYPAEFRSGGRKDGAKNYVIFNENDAEITDHVRFFKTKNGEAYGFTVGGKIYYDPRIANAETPVHEYAHLWASALKANNAEEWKNVVDLMKGTKVWEEVKKTYPELETDDEIADEVLATYSGRRGAERLREEMRKAAAEGDGVMGKAEAVSALQRVKRAIDKFWKAVADFLHIHYTSAEEVADRVMKDLLDGVDPRSMMDGGKSLRPETRVNIVETKSEHGFKNYAEAKTWAKEHIARTYSGEETGGKGDIRISNAAVDKYLSQSAVDKSESKDVHLAVLKVLPDVIRESVDAEQHADFKKGEDGGRSAANGVNPNVTIHRLYGAVRMDGKLYRVKVTLKENTRTKETPKAYSYEATKIELLEGSLSQTEGSHNLEPSNSKSEVSAGQHGNVSGLTSTFPRYSDKSITAANLLKGVEKSYGGGKFFEDYNKIREQFIGEKGAESFDHADEVSTRLDNLSVAREMEAEKKDAKAIKMATGWERGADGKWRYEIADMKEFDRNGNLLYRKNHPDYARYIELLDKEDANLFENGEALTVEERAEFEKLSKKYESDKFGGEKLDNNHRLEAYVDAPELFKAYPELKNVGLRFEDTGGNEIASYHLISSVFDFDGEDYGDIVVNTGKVSAYTPTKELKSCILHEIQHAIQEIEGFASGGSPKSMQKRFEAAKEEWRARAWADALRDKADEMGEHYNQAAVEKALVEEYKEMGMDNDEWMPNKEIRMKGFNYFARGYSDRSKDSDIKNFRLAESTRADFNPYVEYTKLGGEVESRNVEARMGMTAEERRASLAAETEDVSREDQIFLTGGDGGNANSEMLQETGTENDYSEFAKEHGVDADMVKDYALGMETGNLQKANFALTEIRRTMRVANRGMKLSEFGKLFRPVQKELAERYGDIEVLRQEYIDAEMRERGVMEAARKRAEEEAAKRKARADELRLLPAEELDKRYFDAVERGDDAAAREMLDEAARRKGYDDTESKYQGVGAWVAPSNPDYETDEARRDAVGEDAPDLNVEDMAAGYSNQPEDIFVHPDKYSQGLSTSKDSGKAIQTAIDDIRNGKKEVKIKVYRAVPTSVKESKLRNGDWVTPSKEYAEMHGNNRLEGKYRIIEDEVPAGELWWDGNDVNEWGFDDGKGYKYKNVENSRKLNDLVTRDDNGEIIAPSKRFDENVEDVRYRTSEELGQEYGSRWIDEQTNEDGRHTTQVKNTLNSYKKFGDWVMRDSGGKKVDVLDASSGLGLGTEWLRKNGIDAEDVEPYPSENRTAPTYRNYDEVGKKYDYIISNAVLNVIPDDWRANVLHNMADKLKVGGKLVINVRSAESIRKQGKEGETRITLDDPSEILVLRPNGSIKAYQKGFTKAELKEWCEKELGKGYSVEIANDKNAGGRYDTAVVVTKNNESGTIGVASEAGRPRRSAQAVPSSNAKLDNNQKFANNLLVLSENLSERDMGAHEFLFNVAKAFGLNGQNLNKSFYQDLSNSVGIRISDHSANTDNITNRNVNDDVYGLVVKLSKNRFKSRSDANYLEYVYYPDKLTGERQREIVEGLNKFLQTGDYMQLPAPDRVNRSGKFDVLIDGKETSPTAMHQAASDLAQQMHVEGEVEVVTSTDGLTGRQAKAKGWYDVRTGRVTIVLPNNKNAADVRETVFHEVVAHKGLRNLVGEENFNTFLDNVYNNAEEGIKQTIDEMAEKKYNGDKRKATEEYMAHLAEDGEYVKPENQGFFAKVRDFLTDLLRKVGIKLGFKLTDNDLRYILWRSWKGLAERDGGSVFEKAEDVKMQHELGQTDEARSASGENGIMFREGSDELKDVVEKMKADVERLHEGELDDLRSGARAIGGRLSELNKAMRLQRAYDMSTVASVTELAKTMLKNGLLSEMSDYDVRRLLSVVNNVHGKGDIRPYVQKVVDMMVGNRLRNVSKAFDKLLAMRGKKVDARGVEVQGELDLAGQRMADVVWKGIGMSDDDVEYLYADAQDRMMSANGAEAAAAATDYAGWQIVVRYNERIRNSKSEEVRLREDLKRAKENYDAGRMTREAYMEFRESTNDAIRENRIERAEAYEDLYEQLGGAYGESIKRAADFKAAEKARVLEIQHNANSDMEGRPARSYRKDTAVDKVLNSSPVQLLFAPLGTFDQMLRMFGSKNVKGEGYLWNRYMRGWLTATENEYTGYRDATAELDAKAAEVLGKGKTWADLFALERKLPKATVRVWDDGEMRELELPQGNLLYIYMVDKMADGRMKLRKMGVTEDDVAAIEDFLDPRLKEIGDWLQEVYLVEKRGKYNEVHERAYGAAMASIDNYFPLKILKDARAENVDVGVERRESDMLSTITGSVIKRKRNALALDLLNSDAFAVVLDHLQKMEHWSAFAEWNREMNTLLSYRHFRNQVKNMRSAYGSGERLWEAFDKVARIAAGTYDPPKAFADKLAVNIAKGVTAAKISLRVFTALKQFTSFPAYLSDSNPVYLLKGVANPYGSWKWCMENLPLFEKRWKSRMAGDPRLLMNEMDWSLWRDNVVQMAAKWGMTPNGFVDALTVCVGARAMYETRRRKYIRYGYGLEEAERRAKQDASILYNQTQQSSEGAFLSALQVDRSWYSVLFTVFRNSSMSYTRQLYAALRNTGRRIAGGAEFKGISEAFMAKQMERDGIDPEKASKNAKAEYRKSWINDFVRAGVFGYVLPLAWNCGPYALYMMFGDDEKKGKEMWHDIWTHTAFGSVEGLTGGDVWSAGLQSLWNHFVNGEDFNANSIIKDMPLTRDLLNVVKKVGSDNYGAVNDVLNLLVQAGFGVNPQTLTDAAVAIYDYCGSDVETTKECALLVMRVMNCPQSQMDNIYFDEIDATGEEAKSMSVEEIAERYARYKALRGAPLRALSSDALKAAEKKPRERVLTEAKEQLDGRLMTEEAQRYLDEYEATKKKVTETRALADTDPKAFMQQMPALARSGEFRRYRRVGLYKSEVDKLTKKLLRTSDPAERRALFGKMLDARDKMLKQVREME